MELYRIHKPTGNAVPLVADLPHSGQFVPASIAEQWTDEHRAGLPDTDWYLDRLYDFLPELGITVLQATHNRYVVDLNRSLSHPVPGSFETSVVADINSRNQPIYIRPPDEAELQERIYRYYMPYHHALYELLAQTVRTFGNAYLIDLHNFSDSYQGYEIILGDNEGRICSEAFVACLEDHHVAQGFKTGRNICSTGGYISQHYHRMPGVESIHIGISCQTYLRESQIDQPAPPEWDVAELSQARQSFRAVYENVVQTVGHR